MSDIINVILSGGSGTRLWPLSRKTNPKQFIKMINGRSLFQHTLERNSMIADEFSIITNLQQYALASEQAQELDITIQNKVLESVGRNTAPAIAMACLKTHPDNILFVTPSDHMIKDLEVYKKNLNRAIELAGQGFLVTFGIKPTHPETGFGYIEHIEEEVLSFREKPDLKTALKFVEEKRFLWNSGMFCFKANVFLSELKKFRPDILEACEEAISEETNDDIIPLETMLNIPEESVDYAIFEKSDKIKVIPSDFYWTDLGTFDALINFNQNQEFDIDNLTKVEGISVEETHYFGNKKVYGLGISNLVIVDTNDSIVILSKEKIRDIKKLNELIEEKDKLLL